MFGLRLGWPHLDRPREPKKGQSVRGPTARLNGLGAGIDGGGRGGLPELG